MNKRQILFVINNLHVGGAEKALISLLQHFDYDKYSIDLLLFKKEGLFLHQLPEQVKILPEPENFKFFDMPFVNVLKENWSPYRWLVIFRRIQFKLQSKRAKSTSEREQLGWKPLSKSLKKLDKTYDVAIGFLQNSPNNFVIDKVTARKKIGYIHNDYSKLGMCGDLDYEYFKIFDYIVTVSEESRKVLDNIFPDFKDKFKVIKNIISEKAVKRLSKSNQINFKKNSVISVGSLTQQKNYELSIDAFQLLYERGIAFNWYILGTGPRKTDLQTKINKLDFAKQVHFLGVKGNPYPYINSADVFLLTSIYEGDGIVVRESKILNKPIVITDFSTSKSHITQGENGLISEMSAVSVAANIEKLLCNEVLRNKFSQNLSKENWGTEQEISKLYKLIGN